MPGDETKGASGRADRPGDQGTQQREASRRRARGHDKPFRPGDQVDRWTLRERFGKGGSGDVWAAEDESGRKVALKILWKEKYRARFRPILQSRFLGVRSSGRAP